MTGNQLSAAQAEPEPTPCTRLGRVRWTICAMLFIATSINYMDRQVIAILKPTLMHSIGMTDVGYGRIMGAFMIAYAIGLLALVILVLLAPGLKKAGLKNMEITA